jgi:hypothetical protein
MSVPRCTTLPPTLPPSHPPSLPPTLPTLSRSPAPLHPPHSPLPPSASHPTPAHTPNSHSCSLLASFLSQFLPPLLHFLILYTVEAGFLTLMEAFEYLQVGSHLKHPSRPVWVVCSESHYSVLFSADASRHSGEQADPSTHSHTLPHTPIPFHTLPYNGAHSHTMALTSILHSRMQWRSHTHPPLANV